MGTKTSKNMFLFVIKDSFVYIVAATFDLIVQAMLIFIPKGRITDEKNVEDHPACPDIHGFAIWFFFEDFWTEVAWRTGEAVPLRLLTGHFDGETEIRQFWKRNERSLLLIANHRAK